MSESKIKMHLDFYQEKDLYSDGDIEDELLEIAKKINNNTDIYNLLKKHKEWAVLYHFSPLRQNIIEAMNITLDMEVLEIGSGCGALTGKISTKCKHVDCIELSKRRSLINQERNKNCQNVDIYVGNFNDIKLNKKYDVILLVGVLEYAASFLDGDNPFLTTLSRINDMLNDGGKVYIAIENKYGMKYFSGCNEDHSQIPFQSIEGYGNSKIQTFSNVEIRNMLDDTNYDNVYFYYPIPDYKLPIAIYSEDYLPKQGEIRNLLISYDQPRSIFFDEEKAFDNAIKSGHFETFSNSFLVEAEKRVRK